MLQESCISEFLYVSCCSILPGVLTIDRVRNTSIPSPYIVMLARIPVHRHTSGAAQPAYVPAATISRAPRTPSINVFATVGIERIKEGRQEVRIENLFVSSVSCVLFL
jgi:hypothetical protein